MKFFAIVILLLLQENLTLAESLAERSTIRDLIDEFIQTLKNQIPEPINLPDINVAPDNDYVSVYVNATNGTLSGLRDFSVDVRYTGIIIPIPTAFTLSIRRVDLYEDILNQLTFLNSSWLSYNSRGIFNSISTDVAVQGAVDFSLIPLNFSVNSLHFGVSDVLFNIDGFLSEKINARVNEFLSENVANIINVLQEPICAALENAINGLIQGIFNEADGLSPENETFEDNQAKAMEKLTQFIEILKIRLGLHRS